MNIPQDDKQKDLPEEAQGNPVYEQTRQDMPLFCCGRNCGRNSRIVVMVLAIVGIICSIIVCTSHKYFRFEALRNDTFCDIDKQQPEPFEYARIANVGLFKYEIVEVVEYPWPEPDDDDYECSYFQLRRTRNRKLQDENATTAPEGNVTAVNANATEAPAANATEPPTVATEPPTVPATETPVDPNVPLPGISSGLDGTPAPTGFPTAAPTMSDPNDKINVETNKVMSYPDGMNQFDSIFSNAQRGAMMAPIFAFIGILFGLIEFCCCLYKCSWLPTALFLYVAFMFQTLTLFLFLSDDFCKYAQDCKLGYAGWFTVIAVLCYMIANTLVCCTPRPNPCFNCNKKPPVRKKKPKKKKPEDDDDEDSFDEEGNPRPRGGYGDEDGFDDEPMDQRQPLYSDYPNDDGQYNDDGYVDPYDNNSYMGGSTVNDNETYDNNNYDNDTYSGDTYGDNNTYGGEIEAGTAAEGTADGDEEEEEEEEEEGYDDDANWDTDEEEEDDEEETGGKR